MMRIASYIVRFLLAFLFIYTGVEKMFLSYGLSVFRADAVEMDPSFFVFYDVLQNAGYLNFADHRLPLAVTVLGVLSFVPTAILFYRFHNNDLGQNRSVSWGIGEERNSVAHGVYKYIGHPMSTAIWPWVICQALMLRNYIAGSSGIIGFGPLYVVRADGEERVIEKQLGTRYQVDKQKTKRLIPKPF